MRMQNGGRQVLRRRGSGTVVTVNRSLSLQQRNLRGCMISRGRKGAYLAAEITWRPLPWRVWAHQRLPVGIFCPINISHSPINLPKASDVYILSSEAFRDFEGVNRGFEGNIRGNYLLPPSEGMTGKTKYYERKLEYLPSRRLRLRRSFGEGWWRRGELNPRPKTRPR